MSRIDAVEPAEAPEKSRPFLDAVSKSLGMTPNLFRVAAQAPAALEGMVSLTAALSRGRISDAELAAARTAGLTDGEIVEVVGHVVANIFTNYPNNLAVTDIDFPVVHAAAA
jgi:alkylhydroperoxidase family enzyme